MLFTTFPYFIFLLIVLALYYSLCHRWKKYLLLATSYVFYMWFDWRFGGLLLLQTAICYFIALKISRVQDIRRRKWLVGIGALLSFGMLAFFKYFNFCMESFQILLSALGVDYLIPHLNILLPVGISFYIFQSFGYLVDVYRRSVEAEKDFCLFALFVAFFPQLAAGPIGRAPELLPQFRKEYRFDPDAFESGIAQILWGLFKKVVIADRLAVYVNAVYGNVSGASGKSLLLAAIFFSIQIYCDFSGYSDMAIGSARLFGIELRKNFDFPYFSTGINEFWKKWHISLTSWFRDYLYIPLGGNRCRTFRWAMNVMIVFLVSGLWHGAAWTFIVWGGLHGVLQLMEIAIRGRKPLPYKWNITKIGAGILTFVLVTVAWIFFRSPNIATAFDVIKGIIQWRGHLALGGSQITFALNGLLVMLFALLEAIVYMRQGRAFKSPVLRGCSYALLLAAVALLGQTSDSFIYLQF